MTKNSLVKSILAASLLCSGLAIAGEGGNAEAGKAKAAVCGACHGMDGNSVNPEWPNLAGQGEAYIYKQLTDFKAKRRENATMSPQVASLSDQDMKDLAAFFSSQKVKGGKADKSKVELGETVYRGGNSATGVAACTGCHGPDGAGNPAAKFPRLAGQKAKYVENQLKAFRVGARSNDAGKMMRNLAAHLSDAEIEAVAQYITGLRK